MFFEFILDTELLKLRKKIDTPVPHITFSVTVVNVRRANPNNEYKFMFDKSCPSWLHFLKKVILSVD